MRRDLVKAQLHDSDHRAGWQLLQPRSCPATPMLQSDVIQPLRMGPYAPEAPPGFQGFQCPNCAPFHEANSALHTFAHLRRCYSWFPLAFASVVVVVVDVDVDVFWAAVDTILAAVAVAVAIAVASAAASAGVAVVCVFVVVVVGVVMVVAFAIVFCS